MEKDEHGAHEKVIAHWQKLAKCEGNFPLISRVLRGFDPFREEDEPETTDCEVESTATEKADEPDDWDLAFHAPDSPTVAPESNHSES